MSRTFYIFILGFKLEYTLGRGTNFFVDCSDVDELYSVIKDSEVEIYRLGKF